MTMPTRRQHPGPSLGPRPRVAARTGALFGITARFVRFTAVGGVATLIQYVVLVALVQLFNADPVRSSAAGFGVSAFANYGLNSRFTFRSTVAHRRGMLRFGIVCGAGLVLNSLVMAAAVNGLGIHYLLAQVVSTGVVLLWNFALSALWTFRG